MNLPKVETIYADKTEVGMGDFMGHEPSNVIDFMEAKIRRYRTARSELGESVTSRAPSVGDGQVELVDIGQRRAKVVAEERRQVRRTILTEFIAVHVVVPGHGLMKVTMHDISEGGLSFDLEPRSGFFKLGEEIALRVYLNHQTYFPFFGKVQNIRLEEDEGCLRHGINFVKDSFNDEALRHFVRFIETVSASLRTDRGDVMVSKIAQE